MMFGFIRQSGDNSFGKHDKTNQMRGSLAKITYYFVTEKQRMLVEWLLASWLLLVMFIVFLLLSHVVSWVVLDCIVFRSFSSFLF